MIADAPGGLVACVNIPIVGCAPITGFNPVGSAASSAADGVVHAFASYLSAAVSWIVGQILALADAVPLDLGASWFRNETAAMRPVLEAVVVPILLAATIGAVLRQDPKRLARIWAVGLPVSLLAGAATVALASVAVGATDHLTAVVFHGSPGVHQGLTGLTSDSLGTGAPILVSTAIDAVAVIGAVAVWLELLVRSAAIYIGVFFMPLALAAFIWPATAAITKRAVEVLVALILSKFVIFATIGLGLSAAAADGGVEQAVLASGVLLLAAFAPFALMRLAPIVEVAAIAHMEGLSRRPFRAAARTATHAAGAPAHPVVRQMLAGRGGAGDVPPAAAVAPQPLPQRQPDFPIPSTTPADA